MKKGTLIIITAVVVYLLVVIVLFVKGIPTTTELLVLVGADLPIGLILLAAQRALETHEKPDYIKKHYSELNSRIFQKWAKQDSCETRYFVADWGFKDRSAWMEAQAPIFYQAYPVPEKEDYEWFQRAMRHLKARRYHKLLQIVKKMEDRAIELNKARAEWLYRIRGDIGIMMTKYPLRTEGEFYSESTIEMAILAWSAIVTEGEVVVCSRNGGSETIARIKDPTIRNLVLGEILLLCQKYNGRPVEMWMDIYL